MISALSPNKPDFVITRLSQCVYDASTHRHTDTVKNCTIDLFVHIDCNAYFASCEVATRPGLEGRPLVVANGNETGGGVILALTPEAKALGLKRGIPLFKVRSLLRLNDVVVCPADHKKYRRISRQIMDTVQQQGIVLDFVQYSVDEFFGRLPVHYAKHYSGYHGVCVLTPDKRNKALAMLPVADVWGIGRKHLQKLAGMGIANAKQFADCDEHTVDSLFSLTGLRTWRELNGTPCINLNRPATQRSIMQSRTFARMTDKREDLEQAIRTFADACASNLRSQQSVCRSVTVFLSTNRHRDDLGQYRNSTSVKLPSPTAFTPSIIKAALAALNTIYREGFLYKQAGVVLTDITDEKGVQLDLFNERDDERHRKLMQVTDELNRKFGGNNINFGHTDLN